MAFHTTLQTEICLRASKSKQPKQRHLAAKYSVIQNAL